MIFGIHLEEGLEFKWNSRKNHLECKRQVGLWRNLCHTRFPGPALDCMSWDKEFRRVAQQQGFTRVPLRGVYLLSTVSPSGILRMPSLRIHNLALWWALLSLFYKWGYWGAEMQNCSLRWRPRAFIVILLLTCSVIVHRFPSFSLGLNFTFFPIIGYSWSALGALRILAL